MFAFKMKVSIIFKNDTRKLSFKEAKLTGLWAGNCATIKQVVILKFAFGPEKFPGLSRGAPGRKRKSAGEASRTWPGGKQKAGEPVDFVLMPPIHDAVLCYHDMIGQI